MTDPKDNPAAPRSKVAEQALQVLRETREKIDPALLSRMKTLLSPLAKTPPQPAKGLEKKGGLFAAPEKTDAVTPPKAARSSSPSAAAATYGGVQRQAEKDASAPAKKEGPEMIPVDRQKIAQIVMKYMELREEKKPGH